MRNNNKYFQKFVAAIVKRSGIARPTVEALLPHVFDEMRQRLAESDDPCVPIESFGIFAAIERPEHEYLHNRDGRHEVKTVPARRQLKFRPAKNLRCEVEQRQYDPTRRSFTHHPGDPTLATRHDLRYRSENYDRSTGLPSRPIYKKVKAAIDREESDAGIDSSKRDQARP